MPQRNVSWEAIEPHHGRLTCPQWWHRCHNPVSYVTATGIHQFGLFVQLYYARQKLSFPGEGMGRLQRLIPPLSWALVVYTGKAYACFFRERNMHICSPCLRIAFGSYRYANNCCLGTHTWNGSIDIPEIWSATVIDVLLRNVASTQRHRACMTNSMLARP